MKKFNKMLLAAIITGAFSGVAMADAGSTWDQVKHETKSAGHDAAATFNDGQAAINEKLDNNDAALKDKKEAELHRLASTEESVKAEQAKIKGEVIDAREGSSTDRAKEKGRQTLDKTKAKSAENWEKVKAKTASGWDKTKEETSEGWEKTKAATQEGWNKTKAGANELGDKTKAEYHDLTKDNDSKTTN